MKFNYLNLLEKNWQLFTLHNGHELEFYLWEIVSEHLMKIDAKLAENLLKTNLTTLKRP